MKIIAKVAEGNFLAEVSRDEVALLMGFRYPHDKGMQDVKMDIGLELNLTKMAITSEFLRNVDKDKLQKFKNQLDWVIDGIVEAEETIQGINLFEKIKE